MTFQFLDFAAQIKASQSITKSDILALRQWSWANGFISQTEAEEIFKLNNLDKNATSEWVDFFVEAMTEFVINGQEPRGYVSDENAAWLMAQLDKDGKIESFSELELLVRIIEKSLNVPSALKAYALAQVEEIIFTGTGPTRSGSLIYAGQIDDAEVTLIRRLIFAQSSSGAGRVSVEEAEMLFRIKDATLSAKNSAHWQLLFVQGVGNHLQAHSSYKPFSRDEAIHHESFMNDNNSNVRGFLSRIGKGINLSEFSNTIFGNDDSDEMAVYEADVKSDAALTASENNFLISKIDADHIQDPLEIALIEFLKKP
jgi:hypothetical protein